MANRTLNTRIKLRYASYAEWQASTVQLLPGEVAVCYIGANNEEIKNTAPTVLFKVGDGEHTFKDLQWASARAADVYDWAKEPNRPEYSKADVGLGNVRNVEQYSKGEVDDLVSDIRSDLQVDTNTTYEFDLTKTNEITIYSKEKGADRVKVGTFAVSFADLESSINDAIGGINSQISGINTKISGIEGNISTLDSNKANKSDVETALNGKVDTSTYNTKVGELNTAIGNVSQALEDYKTEADGLYMTQTEVDARIDKIITDAVDGDTLTSLTALVQYINEHGGEAAEMAEAIEALEGKLSGIDGTVAKYVSDAIDALKIGDYAKASDLADLAARVLALEQKPAAGILASDITKWNNAQANAEATAKAYTDAEVVKVNNAASTLKGRVDTIEGDYLKQADKEEVSGLVNTEKLRAEAAELALSNRVKNVEDNYLSSTDVIIWDCGGAN